MESVCTLKITQSMSKLINFPIPITRQDKGMLPNCEETWLMASLQSVCRKQLTLLSCFASFQRAEKSNNSS